MNRSFNPVRLLARTSSSWDVSLVSSESSLPLEEKPRLSNRFKLPVKPLTSPVTKLRRREMIALASGSSARRPAVALPWASVEEAVWVLIRAWVLLYSETKTALYERSKYENRCPNRPLQTRLIHRTPAARQRGVFPRCRRSARGQSDPDASRGTNRKPAPASASTAKPALGRDKTKGQPNSRPEQNHYIVDNAVIIMTGYLTKVVITICCVCLKPPATRFKPSDA